MTDDDKEEGVESDSEAGDNTSDNSMTDDGEESRDEDENHDNSPLQPNKVRVCWMNGSKTTACTESINDVQVVDRPYLHGVYVSSASDPTGQVGVVVDVSLCVDLLSHDDSVIADIPSKELKRVKDFIVGDYVVLGSWLGQIEDVADNVTVLFDYGCKFKVLKADPNQLRPVGKKVPEGKNFPYYPGQRVKAMHFSVYNKASSLPLNWFGQKGTVTKVRSRHFGIQWIASAAFEQDTSKPPSAEKKIEGALVITNTRTKVDVAWQDGRIEHGLESTALISVNILADHDFVPEQYVIRKMTKENDNGVIKSVNAKDRTALVRWIKPAERDQNLRQFDKEEVVSVYELEGHPDYDHTYGDIVFRLSPVSTIEESKQPLDESQFEQDKQLYHGPREDESTKKTSFDSDLSWVGNITGLKDGDIQVLWGDGTRSTVGPAAICVVRSETVEDDESETWQSDGENPVMQSSSPIVYEADENTRVTDNPGGNGDLAIQIRESADVLELAGTLRSVSLEGPHSPQRKNGRLAFKGFDTATDPSDHHFEKTKDEPSGSRWLRKVHQDLKSLETDLPDSIYGRVYEDRVSLIRAVIVGAQETPYQDGLFFFDFHLPAEYPNVPPMESTILQVLVSLQGLVLNSKPYFNEAGFDELRGTAEGEKNSESYNEYAFLLNCQLMMCHWMRKPLKDFEDFVKEHFRNRGYFILEALDARLRGTPGLRRSLANIAPTTLFESLCYTP
ncbi:putative ubiquitin-conjugating enzyme E2 23 [Castilleja foliolosa]|uniref:Ubiquitin-conjugating enzyme E2 23 n=1 Tax=Castilleja foliolosa TaxID=1961234 RepID=A0ABD3BXF1_9LAMI